MQNIVGEEFSEDNKRDTGLIWASVRNVIDGEWDEILFRDGKINEKDFDQIFKLMEDSYLERNPLIIQRLNALWISKGKEENTSDCFGILPECFPLPIDMNDRVGGKEGAKVRGVKEQAPKKKDL